MNEDKVLKVKDDVAVKYLLYMMFVSEMHPGSRSVLPLLPFLCPCASLSNKNSKQDIHEDQSETVEPSTCGGM